MFLCRCHCFWGVFLGGGFFFFKLRVREIGTTLSNSYSGAVGAPYASELWVTLDLAGDGVLTAVRESP